MRINPGSTILLVLCLILIVLCNPGLVQAQPQPASSAGALFGVYNDQISSQIRSINTATGTTTPVVNFTVDTLNLGTSAYDSINHRYFFYADIDNGGGVIENRMLVINTQTGVTSSLPVNGGMLTSMEYDPGSGALIGFLGATDTLNIVAMDTTTGAITQIAAIESAGIPLGQSAFDVTSGRYFSIVIYEYPDGTSNTCLLTVQVETGKTTLVPLNGIGGLDSMVYDPVDGFLVGILANSNTSRVITLNPKTGQWSSLLSFAVEGIVIGTSAFDNINRRYFFIATVDDGAGMSNYYVMMVNIPSKTVTKLLTQTGYPLALEYDNFPVDVTSPSIVVSGVNAGETIILKDDGQYQPVTSFAVVFKENVFNPPGDISEDDVTNPANYLLFSTNNDGVQTTSCKDGIQPGDTQIVVNSVEYSRTTRTAIVRINNGVPLLPGIYRLLVCGTTSIVDLFMRPLNGGQDSAIDFSIALSASSTLPKTGFTPGKISILPQQPDALAYSAKNEILLEIPAIDISAPIVGVPMTQNGWDVTWLGKNIGYLNGTAFPTWKGNSVLTAHVWDANNKPGPFLLLKNLKYGDRIHIRAWGMIYIYEVRASQALIPSDFATVLKHEESAWLTLLTCENYSGKDQIYHSRRMVRAILIKAVSSQSALEQFKIETRDGH